MSRVKHYWWNNFDFFEILFSIIREVCGIRNLLCVESTIVEMRERNEITRTWGREHLYQRLGKALAGKADDLKRARRIFIEKCIINTQSALLKLS